MQYLKRNTKYSILVFLIIVLSVTISIFTFAKTEVYSACACLPVRVRTQTGTHADRFSRYDNPQKAIVKNIHQAHALITIAMRDSLSGGFKDLQDLLQLPELTNLDWQEWTEEGIIITIK